MFSILKCIKNWLCLTFKFPASKELVILFSAEAGRVGRANKICNKKIKDLDFPRSAIIGGIVRDGEGISALGEFLIEAGDRVVVCCLPRSIKKVESFFF